MIFRSFKAFLLVTLLYNIVIDAKIITGVKVECKFV